MRLKFSGALLLSLLGLAAPALPQAAPIAALPAPQPPLEIRFDSAAVEAFLRAVRRDPLTEAQWQALVSDRGSREMVRNTLKYVPDTPPEGYHRSLRELARTGSLQSDPYYLAEAVAGVDAVRTLLATIRREEAAISTRIVGRLASHWPRKTAEDPVRITVYLVIGGASDGFVVDGDPAPDFFVAIDKAGGDLAGLEQNFTHESVHVLQRELARRHCPERPSIEKLAPVERFLATAYEEGVANYLADPESVAGDGDYIRMWRDRYRRNASPERMRENDWLYGALLDGLRRGALTWETAYQLGFYGNLDSRMYFVGREIARRHDAAGRPPLAASFVCRPAEFFESAPAGLNPG